MFDKLKARVRRMAEEMILNDGTLVEFKDGELTLISKDGESVTFDGFPEKVTKETVEDAEPIQWIPVSFRAESEFARIRRLAHGRKSKLSWPDAYHNPMTASPFSVRPGVAKRLPDCGIFPSRISTAVFG